MAHKPAPGGSVVGDGPLKAQALRWLSQREHSRLELQSKLERWAVRRAAQQHAGDGEPQPVVEAEALSASDVGQLAAASPQVPVRERVAALLDVLQAAGWLNPERFVDSRLRQRQPRFGNRRIVAELKQHGHALDAQQKAELAATELARARDVLRRRFGGSDTAAEPQADGPAARLAELRERQRRHRFLSARGFSPEVVARVLGSLQADGQDGDISS